MDTIPAKTADARNVPLARLAAQPPSGDTPAPAPAAGEPRPTLAQLAASPAAAAQVERIVSARAAARVQVAAFSSSI